MTRAIFLALPFVIAPWTAAPVRADVEVRLEVDRQEVDSFYFAVGDHFRVGKARVVAIRKRKVRDEHLPVVFYVAQCASVSPDAIVDLRLKGKSWMEISAHFGLTAEIFHVPVTVVPGPPYGKALGHFKNKKRREWAAIQLSDTEVTHLVHLKFLSARHECSPDAIIKLHRQGDTVVKLNGRVKIRLGKAKPRRNPPGRNSSARGKPHDRTPRSASPGRASKPQSRPQGGVKGKGRKK